MTKGGTSAANEGIPAFRLQLGQRITQVIALYPSKRVAADHAEVDVDQLSNYEKGRAKPPLEVMTRLAESWGINLHWLATGQGPMRSVMPEKTGGGLPENVVWTVAYFLAKKAKLGVDPDQYAELFVQLCDAFRNQDGGEALPADKEGIIDFAAALLTRRGLR